MDIDVVLSDDDVEDLLRAIQLYEDELMYGDDQSGYVQDVLGNLDSLRQRLMDASRGRMH